MLGLPASRRPFDINERGHRSTSAARSWAPASSWEPAGVLARRPYHGTLKSHLDTVVAMNERGRVVGTNDERAFVWNDGRVVDLTPPRMYGWWSKPVALNAQVLIDPLLYQLS